MTSGRDQLDPQQQERYQKLRKVPVEKIKGFPLEIVGIPIGKLSYKDSMRANYVLSSVLNDVRKMTNNLTVTFEKIQTAIKTLIEEIEKDPDKEIKQKEIMDKLIEIIAVEQLKPDVPAGMEGTIKPETPIEPKSV